MNAWHLQKITYQTVRERDYEVAVLPIGATEPHGLHLPYGTDAFEVQGIAERVCAAAHDLGAKVILLPTIPCGVDTNMLEFPLAISLHQSTLDQIVTDVVESLEHHGIWKLVIFNGHGGNDFNPLMRTLYSQTNVFISLVNWWIVPADVQADIFDDPGGEHANEMETSLSLALFGDLVHLEDAGDGAVNPTRFEAINRGWATITRPWEKLTRDSSYGDPRRATAEKGERFIAVIVERISRYLKELSDAEMDEAFPF
jgi:creatinine amidohydrolase